MSTVNNGPQIVRNGLVLDLDASYLRSYSPNVVPSPVDVFANIGSEIQSCTLSRDTTITRQYGSIPMKMAVTGNDSYAGKYGYPAANLASALSGQTWTISVWAKASVATDGQLFIFGADTNGAVFVSPDYSAGNMSITTSWQRFSFSYTFTNANTRYIQFRLDGTNSGGSGITIWWDGLQIERASSATPFNPYYFGDTSWRDVSSNGINFTSFNNTTFSSTNKGLLNFNGSNNYLTATENSLFNTETFTIESWARTSTVNQNGFLFEKGNVNTQYAVFFENPNIKIRTMTVNNAYADLQFAASTYIQANQWFLVSASYNSGLKKFYINGVLLGTQTVSGGFTTNANGMSIGVYGGYNGGRGYYYTGDIATMKFYNRTLTDAEVLQNYQTTKTRFGL